MLAALALPVLAAGNSVAAPPQSPSQTAEQARFFETSIRPLLLEQCVSCHGGTQQRSGLRLDSAAAVRKGGTRGPLVVAGQHDASLLWKAVAHEPGVPPMPPGRKLSERQIAELGRWIDQGAQFPESAGHPAAPGAAGHWSFQPVRRPALPAVKNAAWVKTPLDAFVLAELERKGLKPAPPADRRTLIRRATFDLTGLPPTPEEVDAFLADRSADAWAKVIDRLLASPAYGERWGRHWLDVARYADSNGLDENVHYGNAWRYRDWVVQAFNADQPYDRFLTEQIAGDLLPAPNPSARNEQLIATGFLAVGPKFISEVDSEKVLMDMVDEQVDTLGRTVMGLTLGCARCHDHKFDPISTKDYYALAGIFKSTKTLDVMAKPRMWFEHSIASEVDLAREVEYKRRLEALKSRIAGVVSHAKEQLQAGAPGKPLPKNPEPAFPEAVRTELATLRADLAMLEKDAPEMPAAMGLTEGTVADVPVHIRGEHTHLGEIVPRRFPVVLAGAEQAPLDRKQSGRLQLARWLASPSHPLTGRVIVNRVWRWHFGRGIVASTENFGLQGDRPANQPLLDYLAACFTTSPADGENEGKREGVKNASFSLASSLHPPISPPLNPGLGWSFKKLHRLIMLSSTYQMSSSAEPRAAKIDPENRLHSHADLQRLDAEEIRDSLLAVSGRLDRTMGGKSLPLKNREYVFDHTSKDATRYDSRRRTLYLPVIRNNLYDVLQIFDFGDGAVVEGNRPTTTVAPQALFMLNSDMVMDAAEAMAARAVKERGTDAARLDGLYRAAYGRPATPAEQARAAALLLKLQHEAEAAGVPAEQRSVRAWGWFTHTLLAANEFVYLR